MGFQVCRHAMRITQAHALLGGSAWEMNAVL